MEKGSATDLRTFLESGPSGTPTSIRELVEFKKECTPEQFQGYCDQAKATLEAEKKGK